MAKSPFEVNRTNRFIVSVKDHTGVFQPVEEILQVTFPTDITTPYSTLALVAWNVVEPSLGSAHLLLNADKTAQVRKARAEQAEHKRWFKRKPTVPGFDIKINLVTPALESDKNPNYLLFEDGYITDYRVSAYDSSKEPRFRSVLDMTGEGTPLVNIFNFRYDSARIKGDWEKSLSRFA